MNTKYFCQISFYLVMIGLLFLIISLITPWGTFSIESTNIPGGQIDIYSWGIHAGASDVSEWVIFYDLDTLSNMFFNDGINSYPPQTAMYLGIIPIIIIMLLIGLLTQYSFNMNERKFNLSSLYSLLGITTLFLFYIFINFVLLFSPQVIAYKSLFSYSIGFYFMLISLIIVFIAYFLSKYIPIDIDTK